MYTLIAQVVVPLVTSPLSPDSPIVIAILICAILAYAHESESRRSR